MAVQTDEQVEESRPIGDNIIFLAVCYGDGKEGKAVMLGESTVETVCLLSNRNLKPDAYVDLSLDMEDYRRIKAESRQ